MKHYRALVVEDEPVFRKFFSHLLSQSRNITIDPVHVGSAEEAIGLLEEGNRFDMIFLDYYLPEQNGCAVIQKARSLGVDAIIICISSNTDYKIALRLKELGADFYFSKLDLKNQAAFEGMLQTALAS
jgi:CheY-like chemotaxis protein